MREGTPASKLSVETAKFLASAKLRLKKGQTKLAIRKSEWVIGDCFLDHVQKTMLVLECSPAAANGALIIWIPRTLFLFCQFLRYCWCWCTSEADENSIFLAILFSPLIFIALHSYPNVSCCIKERWCLVPTWWVAFAAVGIYMLFAMKRFYGQSWTKLR